MVLPAKITQEQIEAVVRAQLEPYGGDLRAYEEAQVAMKAAADKMKRDVRIAEIRKEIEALEAQIQELLGMK